MQTLEIEPYGVWAGNSEFLRRFWILVTTSAGLGQVSFEHLRARVARGQNEVGTVAIGTCCSAGLAAIDGLRVDALLVGVKLLLVAMPAIRLPDCFLIA